MHGEALLSVAELIVVLHSSHRSGGGGGTARAGAGAAALETVCSHCTVQEEVLVVKGINAILVSFSHRHLIDSVLVDTLASKPGGFAVKRDEVTIVLIFEIGPRFRSFRDFINGARRIDACLLNAQSFGTTFSRHKQSFPLFLRKGCCGRTAIFIYQLPCWEIGLDTQPRILCDR